MCRGRVSGSGTDSTNLLASGASLPLRLISLTKRGGVWSRLVGDSDNQSIESGRCLAGGGRRRKQRDVSCGNCGIKRFAFPKR